MYLHQFIDRLSGLDEYDEEDEDDSDRLVTDTIEDICNKYSLSPYKNGSGDRGITYSLAMSVVNKSSPMHRSTVLLSEFPGNCSSLVLSELQSPFVIGEIAIVKDFIKASLEISEFLRYGALFVTTTSIELRDFLKSEYGFNVVMEMNNPHSGNNNFYMVKLFNYNNVDDE